MKAGMVASLVALSTVVWAQDPMPLPSGVAQVSPEQPVLRSGLAVAGDPMLPAKGWALTPDGDADGDVPGVVSTHGPGVRISTASDLTVFRPQFPLAGEFTVSALFEVQASSRATAPFGLTVGGDGGLAFLVRTDGTFAVQPAAGSTRESWAPVALRTSVGGAPPLNRLEVRVGPSDAAFLVNGKTMAVIPIAPGQLDGTPGVHVGAQGDVVIAAFTVQSATALLLPNVVK